MPPPQHQHKILQNPPFRYRSIARSARSKKARKPSIQALRRSRVTRRCQPSRDPDAPARRPAWLRSVLDFARGFVRELALACPTVGGAA